MATASAITLAALKTAATNYLTAYTGPKSYTATTEAIVNMLDLVGKQVLLAQDYVDGDHLRAFDGEYLAGPDIIQETFINMSSDPKAYDKDDNSLALSPAYPSIEDAVYSYSEDRKIFMTTIPTAHIQKACKDVNFFGELVGTIAQRLNDSVAMYKYAVKKEALAKLAAQVASNSAITYTLAQPTDTATAEAAVLAFKTAKTDSTFVNECNWAGKVAGIAPSLVCVVKKGYKDVLATTTLAGAFNPGQLATDMEIIEVDDFGSDSTGVWAMVMDSRIVRVLPTYDKVLTQTLAAADAENIIRHYQMNVYISKYGFLRVFKA